MKRDERFRRILGELRALASSGPIPREWKNKILKTISRPQLRRGRRLDEDRYAAIAESLTALTPERPPLLRPRGATVEDENQVPSEDIKRIATAHAVSVRTVQRVQKMLRDLLAGEVIDPAKRGPLLRGIGRHLFASATRDTNP